MSGVVFRRKASTSSSGVEGCGFCLGETVGCSGDVNTNN